MLKVDLHSHTFFSNCGIHTHIELLERAKSLGMKALAITDHGPSLDSRITPPFFDRLKDPVEGIRLYKGMECNLVGFDGDIDLPHRYGVHLDIVLLGIHPNTEEGLQEEIYTGAMMKAISKNPAIDIITHPDSGSYPVNFTQLCDKAREAGVAVEINNSRIMLARCPEERMRRLIRTCKESGCLIAVNSDTHAIGELGRDEDVRPLIDSEGFPAERIVNHSIESVDAWIKSRIHNKRNLR